MLTIGAILDRITPWLGRIALALFIALIVVLALNYASCSRQEAAQSKQTARSEKAEAKTAKQTLERFIERHNTETHTREIVTQGQKELDNEQDYRNFRRDVIAAACGLPEYRQHPACTMR